MNPLVAFYEGSAPDDRERSLENVLAFDDEQIEHVHNFIQWLFPLQERSGANPAAPILDDATIDAFRTRPELRANLRRSLDRMLRFYGFTWDGERIVEGPSFSGRSFWLRAGDHNHLRLTRMLRSLQVLGEPHAARALFAALAALYRDERNIERDQISERTFRFWEDAVTRGV